MAKAVEFYFDFGSPASYLAWTQLPSIAAGHGAVLVYRPVLLGGIHKATNNVSPATIPAKGAWMQLDLARFARRYGVQYAYNPHFPINTLMLMRGATGTQMHDEQLFLRYVDAVFRAMWERPRNMGDLPAVQAVLEEAELDPAFPFQLVGDPSVKEKLKSDTEAAVERGLFGDRRCLWGSRCFLGRTGSISSRKPFSSGEAGRASHETRRAMTYRCTAAFAGIRALSQQGSRNVARRQAWNKAGSSSIRLVCLQMWIWRDTSR